MRDFQRFRGGPATGGRPTVPGPDGTAAGGGPRERAHAMVGAVGGSILANADVARAQDRRRETRLRRVLVVVSVVLTWMVLRLVTGHGLFPSLSVPSSLDRWLPALAII